MNSTPNPWYKEPWAWAIVGILATSVCSGLTMLTLGLKYGDDVVKDNYYRDGLLYNQSIQETQTANELGIKATLTFNAKTQTIKAVLTSDQALPHAPLALNLYSPVDEHQDQFLILEHKVDNQYQTLYRPDASARYQIEIKPLNASEDEPTWRLASETLFMKPELTTQIPAEN